MKIAKKVLAVVMAIAMVACLSAMAFATESSVSLKVGAVEDGKFKVEIVTSDADLQSANFVVKYEAATLKCAAAKIGTGLTTAILDGNLIQSSNNNVDGEVQIGLAFTNTLGQDAGVEGEVVLYYMDFEVEDAEASKVTITLEADEVAADTAEVVLKEVEETTTVEVEETTTVEVEETTTKVDETTAKVEETTQCKPAESTTNKVVGPETGDTGVLAIAAGVVALAGAAFVVSKKRK